MAAPIAGIIFGIIELFFGRRLFWLFVALAGFLLGYFLAPAVFPSMSHALRILVGIGLGVVFGLLAIFFTRFMVALAGFFVFGPGAVVLARDLGAGAPDGSTPYWLAYGIGGAIGFVLLWVFFDWGLIILTALGGAGAIVQAARSLTSISPTWQIVLLVLLAVVGFVFQARSYTSRRLRKGPMPRRRGV